MGTTVIMTYECHPPCKISISALGPVCQQNSVSESITIYLFLHFPPTEVHSS
jgi:hypothetical protein